MNGMVLLSHVTTTTVLTATLLALSIAGLRAESISQSAADSAGERKTPTVLFLCPHGAAKSVLASARFRQLAVERGLKVRVDAAGTEPDDVVSPQVVSYLQQQKVAAPINKPRRVSKADLEGADVVISLGCDLAALPARPANLRTWDEVPSPSAGVSAADEAIRQRVVALVEELMAKQRR
jgi:arsenate reductase (thioredoxin)